MTSSTSSSSREYYYIEDEASVGQIEQYLKNPDVVEIRRVGRPHKAHKKVISSSSSSVRRPVRKISSVSAVAGKKNQKNCKLLCIIGWVLAVLFFGLFIGYLVAYLNADGDDDNTPATESPESGFYPGFGGTWPDTIDTPFANRDPVVIEQEEEFVNNIVNQLDNEQMIMQILQPSMDGSSTAPGMSFGPGDIYATGIGSISSMAPPSADGMYFDYNDGTNDVALDGTLLGFKGYDTSARDYVRFIEEFHIKNELYWLNKTGGEFRIPLLIATDGINGIHNIASSTIYPHNIGLGATRNNDLLWNIGSNIATEVAATGLDLVFSPNLSVPRFDASGRVYEGYSEDPAVVYEFSSSIVNGIQGSPDELMTDAKVISNMRSYVGQGGALNGQEGADIRYNEFDMINLHAPGFFSGVQAGAQVVTVAPNAWIDGSNYDQFNTGSYDMTIPKSKYLINDVLKTVMGFDGVVVAEVPATSADVIAAINAGVDIVQVNGDWTALSNELVLAIGTGSEGDIDTIPTARLLDAVTRVLRVKYRAGLWSNDSPLGVACHAPVDGKCAELACFYEQAAVGTETTETPGSTEALVNPRATERSSYNSYTVTPPVEGEVCGRSLVNVDDGSLTVSTFGEYARQAARESLVLIKNNTAVLPVPAGTDMNVGITGSASSDWSKIVGGYTAADVMSTFSTPLPKDAITSLVGNESGSNVYDGCSDDNIDYCFIFIGEDAYVGQDGDITEEMTMSFTDIYPQDADLVSIARNKADAQIAAGLESMKIVVVMFSGRPLYVNDIINNTDAFVAAWLPGPQAGNAITDVLFRHRDGTDYDFVGTLPRTWPKGVCHSSLNGPSEYLGSGWNAPNFEIQYSDFSEDENAEYASEFMPFEYGYGMTYSNSWDIDELPIDSRDYGCLVSDPRNSTPVISDVTNVTVGTESVCSVYSVDAAITEMPCSCWVNGVYTVNGIDCPAIPAVRDVSDGGLTVETDGVTGAVTFESTQGASTPNQGHEYVADLAQPINLMDYYFQQSDNSGLYRLDVTKKTELVDTAGTPQLGVGIVFGQDTATLRSTLDIANVYNNLVVDEATPICIPLTCFNGPGLARSWDEITQPLVISTRASVTLTINSASVVTPESLDADVTCHTPITCDDVTFYPTMLSWENQIVSVAVQNTTVSPEATTDSTLDGTEATDSTINGATDAAVTTTGAAVSNTDAAVTTAVAAVSTTDAAVTTTGAAVSTTDAAVNTTGAAVSNTDAAVTTAVAAVSTTDAAVTTTGAAVSTADVPSQW